ncbi:MAG: hypothetical protein O7H39_02390 [Gammaproteobacteria bacterium]|nr:hypothetical protein [Gammaproteobacteria bacterium]
MGLISRFISAPISKFLDQQRAPRTVPLSDFERIRYELKPCDVLLIEGRSRVSDVVKAITQSPWSHAALYIGRLHDIEDEAVREQLLAHIDHPPSEQLIVESQLGYGTVVRPLAVYEQDHVRICRPKGLTLPDGQAVIRYTVSRLGLPYDVRQIFDLFRFLVPWSLLPRRWRSSLFRTGAGEATRTVCSTLIAEAFGAVQFPILPLVQINEDDRVQLYRRNPKLFVPSDFDYSPYFEIIKYPFMDFSAHASYRLLPWSDGMQAEPDAPGPVEGADSVDSSHG